VQALGERRLALIEDLRRRPSGIAWCADHSHIADEVANLLYDDLVEGHPLHPSLALIATGGYGRRELCPMSDIDITIVPADEVSVDLDQSIRKLFQDLHWAFCTIFRLDVGYSYRLISDAPGLDSKTRTGLLDMRLLAGSQDLFRQLDEALQNSYTAGDFILAKIEERREMRERFNDTPLVIEPQLKEGAGGLRDFHCANWIGEAIGERPSRPTAAYDTIIKYRNLLHLVTKKPQDLLTRTRQADLAAVTGKTPDEMLAEIASAGSELNNAFLRSKEKLFEARFALSPAALAVGGEVRLLPQSNAGEAATGIAIATKLGLRVSDLPLRAIDSSAGPSAVFAISTGEQTIRNLDRCTLLGQLRTGCLSNACAGGQYSHLHGHGAQLESSSIARLHTHRQLLGRSEVLGHRSGSALLGGPAARRGKNRAGEGPL
jgi:[protein-PII] uridylyltransferase